MSNIQLGIVGLGTMGANLARNAARNGAKVAVFNRTTEKMTQFIEDHGGEGEFIPCKTLEDLVAALQPPRAILIMVKAGKAVDEVIAELSVFSSHLSEDDVIIDAGNSHYKDTERRITELSAEDSKLKTHYLGMGVSGGEEGALNGPSMMPGGSQEGYRMIEPLLTKMAADDSDGGKCITYCGPGGAGHFVKMVHNGIEYGDMQLIAETYHLLSYLQPGMENEQLGKTFEEWNNSDDLKSFLIEITAKIFQQKDVETGKDLIDIIKDAAKQKGTGKWTTESALDLGVAVPTITAAVDARIMSSLKEERIEAHKHFSDMKVDTPNITSKEAHSALLVSKICSYAQGFRLLKAAGEEYGWNLDLAEVTRIWQGGCIIRSVLLKTFMKAFQTKKELPHLLLDPTIQKIFKEHFGVWTQVISKGVLAGVPLPAMSASLAYFESYTWDRLPQNLTQAQRDFFGAHTYERIDKEGTFHTEWE